MFAIVETGGKQFRVEEGLQFKAPKMEAEVGAEIALDRVLLVQGESGLKVGQPLVEGAVVRCQVVDHGRDKKIIVFKKKRRKGYSKKQGHRQDFTLVKVTGIEAAL
ncbi:MAG: ribosomal protein [Desulfomicrobiaceae bacterium]|jgi:large subunit ribosomal protein L21|uniref:50S ribosomal protein L21 n=1 Tax=Thermodesulfomicrobium sp. WS TaxID=3004129 RepID=UPI000EEE7800|nr:50S ribosomal protein L21 [Thermodesulfomicrobium sp. WS]MBC7354890.1 50S ribosomal protein L21 [Desulfomicrobiaceae bacterium]MBZ4648339.1 ribosomal protein [Desulfomicrobiaceae bacterium]MBZ4686088.1 ribosomal protein [Desulfomicrobiaceae bacterium]MDI3493126.1 large subunit ribosomal protein [Desulfomicrobiaceae bacterium]MDK2874102.1 large subunit ribosomal protein [Desulfomicrobiaceae bacterium]